jgi:phosphoribosylglycinamide formyltransferase 1
VTGRLAVLVSGDGSNLQAVLDACRHGQLDAKVELVVSNNPLAYALQRSSKAGVRTVICEPKADEAREEYDARLVKVVQRSAPDFIVLAGWMRLLSMTFLSRYPGQVVNLHPALPGEYPGTKAIERAFADAQAGERDHTGVMVHFVPDEGIDSGPVVASERVDIAPADTLATLEKKMHRVEQQLLVSTLAALIAGPVAASPTQHPSTTRP